MQMFRIALKAGAVLASLALLSACGNTIRGVGQDTANMVHATKQAGHDVANSM